jgi:hypothetical protein
VTDETGDNGAGAQGLKAKATFVLQDGVRIALKTDIFALVEGSRGALVPVSALPDLSGADKVDTSH